MPRFYLNTPLAVGQQIALPDNVVRHLNVLRLRENETVVLFNGNGIGYVAQLNLLGKKAAQAVILSEQPADNESPLHITLIQAVSSGERMDFTLQKSVELGVSEIFPVGSERSIVRLSGERADKRVTRWQDIVISACEQSGRNRIPQVHPLTGLEACLKSLPEGGDRLLMSLNQPRTLSSFTHRPERIVFMVGPEGGWTPQEERLAEAAGFQAILLGKRVLRTETASLAAIAAMQTLWGDF